MVLFMHTDSACEENPLKKDSKFSANVCVLAFLYGKDLITWLKVCNLKVYMPLYVTFFINCVFGKCVLCEKHFNLS